MASQGGAGWGFDDDAEAPSGGAMVEREAWTPTRANQEVAARTRDLRGLRVCGEVSQPRLSGGHLYFDLKDERSRMRAVVWRSTLQRSRIELRDGDQIICHGDLDVWVQGGSYSLVVHRTEPAGVGALFAALQRLPAKLEAEGLFAPERKRRLPFLPQRVGIVTALGGAALRDVLRVLHDRFPVAVLIAPAKVQGPGAAQSIVEALQRLDATSTCDVIIVGRGGGSIEDLWAFHDERLVRAIAGCRAPVVSAVGHETDTLLSDLVADVRAPTPTAAAELVVPRLLDLQARLAELRGRARQVLSRRLQRDHRELALLERRLSGDRILAPQVAALEAMRARLEARVAVQLHGARRLLEALRARLQRCEPRRRLDAARLRRERLQARLLACGVALTRGRRRRHERAVARLQQIGGAGRLFLAPRQRFGLLSVRLLGLDPRLALRRGFAIVRHPDTGAVVRDASEVQPGTALALLLARGRLDVIVERSRSGDGATEGQQRS